MSCWSGKAAEGKEEREANNQYPPGKGAVRAGVRAAFLEKMQLPEWMV